MDHPRAGGPDTVEILTIALGGEIFALPAGNVLEILDVGPVTPVPNAAAFVGNLINFRGRVAPLADLRLRCGMAVAAPTQNSRIVVLEFPFEGEPILAPIPADEVYEGPRLDAVVTDQGSRVGTRWR